MKKINSEELSSLSASSRVTKLGTAGIAIIIGLLSIVITIFYSLESYRYTESTNAIKKEKIQNINESSIRLESDNEKIRVIINTTDDPVLKEQLIEWQKNIKVLIDESKETNELLEKDIKSNYRGSSLDFNIISVAYAADTEEPKIKKQYVLWAILALLASVYLGALYSLFFSRSSRNIDLATDLVKTLTGFYIGIATTVVA